MLALKSQRRRLARSVVRLAPVWALAAAASGCAGSSDGSSSAAAATRDPPAKFSDIFPMIFPRETRPQCVNCHGRPADQVGNGRLSMGMDAHSAHDALVGKTSMSDACAGRTLVVPGDPDTSLLVQKIGAAPPCGDRMPLGGAPLSDAQISMIRGWIAAGANDD